MISVLQFEGGNRSSSALGSTARDKTQNTVMPPYEHVNLTSTKVELNDFCTKT